MAFLSDLFPWTLRRREGQMPNGKMDDDRWFWPLVAVLLHATMRAGRDGLVALFRNVFVATD